MRLIKMFGLAALAAVAAMAFVGAGSAYADEDTALCSEHEEPCAEENLIEHLHLTHVNPSGLPAGDALLLSNLPTVLCLEVLALALVHDPLLAEAPEPLGIETELLFDKCGTEAAHKNCTVTVLEDPLINLLKVDLNLGEISADPNKPGRVNLACTISIFKVNCDFEGGDLTFGIEGALHQGDETGRGMLTADDAETELTEALGGLGFICPQNPTLDGLLEPLEEDGHVYITS